MAEIPFLSGFSEGTGFAVAEIAFVVVVVAIAAGFGMSREEFLESVGHRLARLFRRSKATEAPVEAKPPVAHSYRSLLVARLAVWLCIIGATGFFAWNYYLPEFNQPQPVGDVVWNFDAAARGAGFFLGMFKTTNSQDIRVLGFQAHGRNISGDPIQTFSGEIRSDLTNITKPVYILGQDDKSSPIAACLPRIPTKYDDTYGVPGLADFDVTTFEKVSYSTDDGVPAATFLHDFAPFTLTLKYNGATVKRRFTTEDIQKQFDLFSKITSMQSIPRVIRRETAAPPIFSRLEPLLKVTPLPQLQLLIPPDATPTGSLPKGN